MSDKKRICFVIMGYGTKTDYSTARTLDLDKTYRNIIKPAAEAAGLKCVRADDIRHSGIIDVPMYQYILSADVVIADLSTYNPNALYELGVRHALQPHTTITISEKDLKYPFDVEHTVIRKYEHLGKGIDFEEVERFRQELIDTINEILHNPQVDSPVYTYLQGLQPPVFQPDWSQAIEASDNDRSLSQIVAAAQQALDSDEFETAKVLFTLAHSIDKKNVYVVQKLCLATYKSKKPDHISALTEALSILDQVGPDTTTDPETLGLSGAIYKRLWEETIERTHLDKSVEYYERGFYIKRDYYNGINFAYLLNVRGNISGDQNEAIADYVLASRVRKQVVRICEKMMEAVDFEKRDDRYWILATMEEALFGLGELDRYKEIKKRAQSSAKENWERKTTEEQIHKLGLLINAHPLH
ncbi:DUF4071 domain-containing protein [Alicyclobacillus fastidiosus]|uniref:DUF4071 domain-containing protein n=1 Tax=Alicyclobacillus fastidiosus TaxID=392011 RepID=A0ABY6ZPZ9_9BACL|nr:TRAFs-binding domain-containing protein [Alicyclobacillus fastidiosus]WAH44015.1 DUF4071 domain-containing protein [Alicyclobacillus fastidiosus]GMA60299.1 hypothetical protein GCM10025859_07390 [Alicyclobacillus fastidiosus]